MTIQLKDSIKKQASKFIGFNDRGIVEYWEKPPEVKCICCGFNLVGKGAEEHQFGHIGCPNPRGHYVRNDFTAEDLLDFIDSTISLVQKETREEMVKKLEEIINNVELNCPIYLERGFLVHEPGWSEGCECLVREKVLGDIISLLTQPQLYARSKN